jgi:trehalose 6-phosphate phosphatase
MDELVRDFARQAPRAGIFCDFDGTLSEIVDVPSEARAVQGAARALVRLAQRFRVVAVVSGRSTDELIDRLGTDLEIWGLHGAERSVDGSVIVSELAAPYVDVMEAVGRVAAQKVAEAGLAGVLVEEKGPMLGLHYRMAPDPEAAYAALDRLSLELAEEHGLARAVGRKVIELRPPLEFSKQNVVLEVTKRESLDAVAFIGDDSVDIPAFQAIDELKAKGLSGLKVAVFSEEVPDDLLSLADLVLTGPADVVGFLEDLREAAQ